MNVYIDGMILSQCAETGIISYVENLVRQFSALDPKDTFTVMARAPLPEWSGELQGSQSVRFVSPPSTRFPDLWKAFGVGMVARKANADWLFLPVTRAPFIRPRRTAVTVIDLGYLTLPEFQARSAWRVPYSGWHAIRHADVLFTISEAIRTELLANYAVDPHRVHVTHLGVDHDNFHTSPMDESSIREVKQRYALDRPFILYVGVIQPRKNLVALIRAYEIAAAHPLKDYDLILAGRPGWNTEQIYTAAEQVRGPARVKLIGGVPQRQLPTLIRLARAFAFVSLYEGFGLSALEAMACGVPTLCSNIPALQEVCEDSVYFCDPHSSESMAEGLVKVCEDETLRARLARKGPARAKQFTWSRCAAETLEVLRESPPRSRTDGYLPRHKTV